MWPETIYQSLSPVACSVGPRFDLVPADRPGATANVPPSQPAPQPNPGHDQHLPTTGRGRGPRGAGGLGRRSVHRQNNVTAIGTLVERATGDTMFVHLPRDDAQTRLHSSMLRGRISSGHTERGRYGEPAVSRSLCRSLGPRPPICTGKRADRAGLENRYGRISPPRVSTRPVWVYEQRVESPSCRTVAVSHLTPRQSTRRLTAYLTCWIDRTRKKESADPARARSSQRTDGRTASAHALDLRPLVEREFVRV